MGKCVIEKERERETKRGRHKSLRSLMQLKKANNDLKVIKGQNN